MPPPPRRTTSTATPTPPTARPRRRCPPALRLRPGADADPTSESLVIIRVHVSARDDRGVAQRVRRAQRAPRFRDRRSEKAGTEQTKSRRLRRLYYNILYYGKLALETDRLGLNFFAPSSSTFPRRANDAREPSDASRTGPSLSISSLDLARSRSTSFSFSLSLSRARALARASSLAGVLTGRAPSRRSRRAAAPRAATPRPP